MRMHLTPYCLLSVLMVSCLSEKPDSALFSSVAEMSKLAKLELTALSQLKGLRHLIDQRLAKREIETEEFSEVHTEIKQIFDKLPPSSELEGAGNGEFYKSILPLTSYLLMMSFQACSSSRKRSSSTCPSSVAAWPSFPGTGVSQRREGSRLGTLTTSARSPSTGDI